MSGLQALAAALIAVRPRSSFSTRLSPSKNPKFRGFDVSSKVEARPLSHPAVTVTQPQTHPVIDQPATVGNEMLTFVGVVTSYSERIGGGFLETNHVPPLRIFFAETQIFTPFWTPKPLDPVRFRLAQCDNQFYATTCLLISKDKTGVSALHESTAQENKLAEADVEVSSDGVVISNEVNTVELALPDNLGNFAEPASGDFCCLPSETSELVECNDPVEIHTTFTVISEFYTDEQCDFAECDSVECDFVEDCTVQGTVQEKKKRRKKSRKIVSSQGAVPDISTAWLFLPPAKASHRIPSLLFAERLRAHSDSILHVFLGCLGLFLILFWISLNLICQDPTQPFCNSWALGWSRLSGICKNAVSGFALNRNDFSLPIMHQNQTLGFFHA